MTDKKFTTTALCATLLVAWISTLVYLDRKLAVEHAAATTPDVALIQRAERAEGFAEGVRARLSSDRPAG